MLVRHGETEWSKSGRHTSTTELSLTDNGRTAALALAPRLESMTFARVFASPRKRARETAALALPKHNPQVLDDLAEWNYGEYEGLTTKEIRQTRPEWNLFTDGCPGGESPEQVVARCGRVIDVCESVDGVLCFAHGHILRALAVTWMNLPISEAAHWLLDTGTVSVLTLDYDEHALRNWNS